MTNEIIFYTQVVGFISFIVTLFVLYRTLVKNKDSSIELLKEKNEFLSIQLAEAKKEHPDILNETLSSRAKVLEEELIRLSKDKEVNIQEIHVANNELRKIKKKLEIANNRLIELGQYKEVNKAILEQYEKEIESSGNKQIETMNIIEALQKRNEKLIEKLSKYEDIDIDEIVPLGGSIVPLRSSDSIMWTIKFRNGTMKKFKFPIRSDSNKSNDPYGVNNGGDTDDK